MTDYGSQDTYLENPSRFDSTPQWYQAQSLPTTAESNPQEGYLYWDPTGKQLMIYEGGSFTAYSSGGGGGGGAVDSVQGKIGTVVLKATDIPIIVSTKTSAYTIVATDQVILADATSAAFNLTLPTAVGFTGRLVIVAITNGTNLVTLKTVGGQTLPGGGTSTTLGTAAANATYQTLELVSDSTNWWIA